VSSLTETSSELPEEGNTAASPLPQASAPAADPEEIVEAGGSNSAEKTLHSLIEIAFVIAWAVFFARDYLDFSLDVWPVGREFGMAIQTNFIWTMLPVCGDCMLWNGTINGGSPAFAELHGAVLHPLVILPTLIWGGLNGAKVALIAAIAMAGIAQWWLAKAMNLGLVARIWAGMMAVVGGHLAGKMDIGVFGVVISTAAASLVIAAGVDLALTERRRSAVLLGIMLALAVVSGQGYMQLGLLLGIIPAFAVFIFDENFHLKKVWREYVLAAVIGLLLAGVFLVPMLHFYQNFGKAIEYLAPQTIGDSLLNLVIQDLDVYRKEVLGTLPYPYQYLIFVGWIPILLAIASLRLVPRQQSRLLSFFLIAIVLVYLLASAIILNWIGLLSEELASYVRIPSIITGLSVPLILGLAAWSADLLLRKDWPITIFSSRRDDGESEGSRPLSFSISWIIVGILLVISLRTAYTFSQGFLRTYVVDGGTFLVVEEAETLNPAYTQWTELPFGEHFWAPVALEAGLKLTNVVRPWHWRDRPLPDARLTISRHEEEQSDPDYLGSVAGTYFRGNPEVDYAFVQTDTESIPCDAQAYGGHIDVTCDAGKAGTLFVREYVWTGWEAQRDGQTVMMDSETWLNAEAPAGAHQFRFRYRPWDVYVGLALTVLGIILCIWIWFYHSDIEEPPAPAAPEIIEEEAA
jgi:hypothetical protein